jgi:hypothetical protein
MLILLICGAVWGDLNRPITPAEARACAERPFRLLLTPPNRWEVLYTNVYLNVRGNVLVTRIKPGMSQDEVVKHVGAIPKATPQPTQDDCYVDCSPFGMRISYRVKDVQVAGKPCRMLIVEEVRGIPFRQIVARFVADLCRR